MTKPPWIGLLLACMHIGCFDGTLVQVDELLLFEDTADADTGTDADPFVSEDSIFYHPDRFADMIPDFADFWTGVRDDEAGGYFTWVERDGTPDTNGTKTFVTQSRDAWGFSRAFMITGDERYLEHGEHALAFLYTHGWDNTNGGWYYEVDRLGSLTGASANRNKWSFGQHYNLLGIVGMLEATGDPRHREWLDRGWQSNETHLWDDDPKQFGYFDYASGDWSSRWGKGFTPTVDAVTTNVLSRYLVTGQNDAKERMDTLAQNMVERLLTPSMDDRVVFGFAESYDSGWNLNTGNRFGFVGHVLKTSWCLARAHLLNPSDAYLKRAAELILDVWNNGGYDSEFGGPYTDFWWDTGNIKQTNKEYWQVEQAITAGLMNFHVSNNTANREIFLQMAEESMEFFLDHLVDPEYGEIFVMTDANGMNPVTRKGDTYKAAYHGIETLYYAYLYGSLFYRNLPVTLHYRFIPENESLWVKLTPCAIEDDQLEIASVTRNGQAWNRFDRQTRTLLVPPGEGGIFAVQFRRVQ